MVHPAYQCGSGQGFEHILLSIPPWYAPLSSFPLCSLHMKNLQESVQPVEEDVIEVVCEPDAIQVRVPTRRVTFNKRVAISAYMAIAASAFGLISDGCTYPYSSPTRAVYSLDLMCLCPDHANMMTMTNVSCGRACFI